MNVVAEQKLVTDRHHVSRDAVVRGGDAFGAQEARVDRAEDLLASVVELRESRLKVVAAVGQAAANDFVRTAFQPDIGSRGFGLVGGWFGHLMKLVVPGWLRFARIRPRRCKMSVQDSQKSDLSQRAMEYYDAHLKERLEAEHFGKVVGVDPDLEAYVVADDSNDAALKAYERFQGKSYMLYFRIGGGGAVKIGGPVRARVS